ncbi:MAG: DNA gyrase/topoisomerase IV subunit A [Bacteroidetes bacterium]|nr:DNA gyrase/topoisomerase IV subunit A [Bacteroidota bacterium]
MDNNKENKELEEDKTLDVLSGQEGGFLESMANTGDNYEIIPLTGMYKNWFLDYASYVILERAVPEVNDGLKPVQRRILHAMKELDDGRYNKVANIIGHTMKYHPHGDASIGDALVQLGQKDLLIDIQGNWGNILTGDSAAAPRYIEARLSRFALEVVFNSKTTKWKPSYDGRNKEPYTLPVKFPLLLTQGVEGIAVGLASKILPHNFNELIDASIRILQDKNFDIRPDFLTGGLADFSKYNDGIRGGKVRIRAKINKVDKKTLSINDIPYGTNTSSLIDSIVAANDKGKIKIRKIDDNTAENVEIIIHLSSGISPDQTIDALYAFTNCEISVSPNSCVIGDDKPNFMGVREILRISTRNTLDLLKRELEIRKAELEDQWHFASLEKIFIEKRIYRKIEECKTWKSVIDTIGNGLQPYKKLFLREITQDDIIHLTEIKIKRISKYNSLKADDIIKGIEEEIKEVKNHLQHLIDYAINYFRQIRKKYGKGRERKTEIRNFDTIQATAVAAATQKLYVNRKEGFAGTSLRKDEYVCDCSDIDDVIIFREDGSYMVTKVVTKTFVGKNIIHIDVFKKNDDRTIYNIVYRDGRNGKAMVKRFAVLGIMRDKEYNLTKGVKGSKVLYYTVNPNGEAEVIKVYFRPKPRMKNKNMEFDFSTLAIKSKSSKGNILSRHGVLKIVKKEEGVSTLGAIDIWYDDTVRRLNTNERGVHLGAFKSDDKILAIMQSGAYKLHGYDLSTHFDEDMIMIEKYTPGKIITAIYYDGKLKFTYIKRFRIEETDKKITFIGSDPDTILLAVSLDRIPQVEVVFDQKTSKKPIESQVVNLAEFIGVKSSRAKGKRLSRHVVKNVNVLEPLSYDEQMVQEQEGEVEKAQAGKKQAKKKQVELKEEENTSDSKREKRKENKPARKSGDTEQMTLDF